VRRTVTIYLLLVSDKFLVKARMILECSKEVIEFKKTEKPTEKQLRDLMKKYEDKFSIDGYSLV